MHQVHRFMSTNMVWVYKGIQRPGICIRIQKSFGKCRKSYRICSLKKSTVSQTAKIFFSSYFRGLIFCWIGIPNAKIVSLRAQILTRTNLANLNFGKLVLAEIKKIGTSPKLKKLVPRQNKFCQSQVTILER